MVYTACVYEELDNEEGAAEVIRTALEQVEKKEDHPMLLLASGNIDLHHQDYKSASQAAFSVLSIDPKVKIKI